MDGFPENIHVTPNRDDEAGIRAKCSTNPSFNRNWNITNNPKMLLINLSSTKERDYSVKIEKTVTLRGQSYRLLSWSTLKNQHFSTNVTLEGESKDETYHNYYDGYNIEEPSIKKPENDSK